MSCPQSLLEQLLSQPHEEALKVLNVLRSSYVGSKRVIGDPSNIIACNDTHSTPKYDPIVYDQVFRPPPPKLREANKLYGREFLVKYHPDQSRVMYFNYGEARKWFAKEEPIGDLRNNSDRKNLILKIIRENIGKLQSITINGVPYPWMEEDIYSWCIKSLASKRKWRKRKTNQATCFSAGTMVMVLYV